MITLDSKVDVLNGVGKVLLYRLKKIGIETVKDLIFYYPFRYDDFSQFLSINKLQAGMTVTVRGSVDLLANKKTFRKGRTITEGLVTDDSGSIKVIWFNQPWIAKNISIGDEIILSGKVSGDMFNVYFNSPSYEKAGLKISDAGAILPVYPLTEGITQKQLRFLIKAALKLVDEINECIPGYIIAKEKLMDVHQALKEIHIPSSPTALSGAKKRLSFEELFLVQVWSQILKKKLAAEKSLTVKFFADKTKEFIAQLGFELTADQKRGAWEILQDMQKNKPMNRLLEGDVGSGKTLVAIIALLNVYLSGYQSSFMAPTEILASQHYKTCLSLLGKYLKVGLLTGSMRIINDGKVSKKDFLEACGKGDVDIIIGTHALISKEVKFKKLALAIIDEQHRFGVEQRQLLRQKAKMIPHFLSLTATPIPRSLALTLYGDLDLSIIKQMPSGRKKIVTKIVPPDKRQLAYDFIAKQISLGRQVFIICPLIDPSDKLGVRSVVEEHEKLDKEIFPDISVGLLHGRLKSAEKEDVLEKFNNNKIKILVSTSVIEVGIDVPNASVMMIEGADRFGLAQLHQFRGRVGRGQHQSYCFLFSATAESQTIARLQSLADCHDGFALAQKDLELRGSGNVYGLEQSGFANLKIANLTDLELIKKTRVVAQEFVGNKNINEYPLLVDKINSLGFSDHLE